MAWVQIQELNLITSTKIESHFANTVMMMVVRMRN
jgi:hypothetical protein